MKIDIMEFLLENDVILKDLDTKRCMTADFAESPSGQFVVYYNGNDPDIYRGDDFEEAVRILSGGEE